MLKVRNLHLLKLDESSFVNFDVRPGEVLQVQGGPGSGKTKLFKILAGVLRPLCGDVFLDGISMYNSDFLNLAMSRKKLGVIFEEPNILSNLTLAQNIEFILNSRFMDWDDNVDKLVDIFFLKEFLDFRKLTLSRDAIKRFNFLKIILCSGKLLVFDEISLSEVESVNRYFVNYLFSKNDDRSIVFIGDVPNQLIKFIDNCYEITGKKNLGMQNAS